MRMKVNHFPADARNFHAFTHTPYISIYHTFIYIYIFNNNIIFYTYMYTHIHIYIYILI